MTHRLVAIASLAAAVCLSSSAFAQSKMMECNEANMKMGNDNMMKMSAGANKTAVMKEMDMAKDMMAKKDMKGCAMHMNKSMDMMK